MHSSELLSWKYLQMKTVFRTKQEILQLIATIKQSCETQLTKHIQNACIHWFILLRILDFCDYILSRRQTGNIDHTNVSECALTASAMLTTALAKFLVWDVELRSCENCKEMTTNERTVSEFDSQLPRPPWEVSEWNEQRDRQREGTTTNETDRQPMRCSEKRPWENQLDRLATDSD